MGALLPLTGRAGLSRVCWGLPLGGAGVTLLCFSCGSSRGLGGTGGYLHVRPQSQLWGVLNSEGKITGPD